MRQRTGPGGKLARVAVGAIAAVALAGAWPAAGGALPAARAGAARQIEFWTISLSPFFDNEMRQLASEFEASHPGVQVKWTDVPIQAIQQKLLSAIAAGTAPDVVNLNSDTAVQLYQQGALLDLGKYAPKQAWSVYFPRALATFKDGDVIYGAPWYWAPKVMAYNVEIFRKAGLDPERPPTTVEGMIEAAKRIKDKTGLYGFMPNINGVNFLFVFQEAGLPVLDENGSRALFNSPEHVKLVEQYADLFKQDYIPEDTMRRGYLGATELYTAGRLGMLLTGPQFLIRVQKDNPAIYESTRAAAYPLDKGRVIHTPLMGFSVPVNTRNKELAVEFALFATDDAHQLAFAKASNTFPSTIKAARDSFFTKGGPTAADQARVADAAQLQYAQDLTVHVPNASKLFKAFKDNVEAAFFGGKPVKQALDEIVRIWNAEL
ncbi:sugar ABC transporter substrate-binding protein [Carboxydochorda subterranea]|uniref:Sugar ABC transporter substrate-binding protein n=1 Tax=Carboxydichorda subterranea TaxID=3109565 RepID=A0ABZ1BXZ9_9FIRM|nr:sugar ABC transporter substrate-binding protein [Limnochorda sp. L945t]WRP17588.1 sugar ABC transporter substrate-binding protein [Limnochorda sp. L945t]